MGDQAKGTPCLKDKAIMFQVLSFLSPRELMSVSPTSKAWGHVTRSESLWREVCRIRWSRVWLPWTEADKCPVKDPKVSWRDRYLLAEKEARREDITVRELGRYLWKMSFADEPDKLYFAKFKPRDIKRDLGCGVMSIPALDAKYLGFVLDHKVNPGGGKVGVLTIENFLPHYTKRSDQWRWVIANDQVRLESVHESEAPDEAAKHEGRSRSWDVLNLFQQTLPAADLQQAEGVDADDLRYNYECPELQNAMALGASDIK
mmetsp:Transcript_6529/g.12907  ORF Transcript_6529/g.12907 Transcript_6529/m.12907 type:complete len:260 (+) Transcript_6529:47-826(+)